MTLADAPVHLRITGLAGGEQVTVTSSADDHRGQQWQARAVFRADRHGTVALDTAAPLAGGSYAAADGMGLFWSMDPVGKPADRSGFLPVFPEARPSFDVRITVTAHGRELARPDAHPAVDGRRGVHRTADRGPRPRRRPAVPPAAGHPGEVGGAGLRRLGGRRQPAVHGGAARLARPSGPRRRLLRRAGAAPPCTTCRSSTSGRPRACSPRSPRRRRRPWS
ncbi:acyl-CoA thioesterase/BAAT N-terminal domain-containing protein [Kitasatospora arboriphila]